MLFLPVLILLFCPVLALEFSLRLKYYYDSRFFVKNFGFHSKCVKNIRKLSDKLQEIFNFASFRNHLKIEIENETSKLTNYEWKPSEFYLQQLGLLVQNISAHLHIFITANHKIKKRKVQPYGISYVNSVCYFDITKRIIILEWKNDPQFSAYILAHEIGHSLGIEHDFLHENEPRYDLQNQSCSNIGG